MKQICALSFVLGLLMSPHFAYSEETGLTMEQVEEKVLQSEPGASVTGHDLDHDKEGNKIYGFEVTKEDGTILKIETDEQGAPLSRKIKELGEGVELPPATIDKSVADKAALDHINATKFGVKGRVLGSQYKLYNGAPAYEVIVKKSMKDTYRVYVDPEEGKILGSEYVK